MTDVLITLINNHANSVAYNHQYILCRQRALFFGNRPLPARRTRHTGRLNRRRLGIWLIYDRSIQIQKNNVIN